MAKSKPRNKNIPRPPRPVIPMKPKPNGDKEKQPRPTIPMKPKPQRPQPPKSALEELEKHFGPVKWAEPDKSTKKPKKPKKPAMQPNGVWTILGTK